MSLELVIGIIFSKWFITYALLSVLAVVVILSIILKLLAEPYAKVRQSEDEKYFVDPNQSNARVKFPSILSEPSIYLSVVVPSYNEEKRLPVMLDEALEYLENRRKKDKSFSYEIIVVDDGSRDKTSQVALVYSKKYTTEHVRVLTQDRNRGKGGAIRMGVVKSRGKLILFADADGATKFSDIERLEAALAKNTSNEDTIVCGSRRHLEKDSVAQRSAFRTFLMYGFHFLVWFLCVKGIRDTQCGFKLLTRSAAIKTFFNLHVERWAFDVDLLFIAEQFKIKVFEQDVNWQECDGSKITFGSYVQMGKDLISIRLHYLIGAWKLNPNLRAEE